MKPKHGGARTGAGRKKNDDARVVMSVRVHAKTINEIDKNRRDESRGQFIEKIVNAYILAPIIDFDFGMPKQSD